LSFADDVLKQVFKRDLHDAEANSNSNARSRNPWSVTSLARPLGRNPVECCLAWEAVVSKGHDVTYPYFWQRSVSAVSLLT